MPKYPWIEQVVKHQSFVPAQLVKLDNTFDRIKTLANVAESDALFNIERELGHALEALNRLSAVVTRFAQDYLPPPSDDEIKKELGI